MTTELMQAYSSGVLNPEVHGRLAQNLAQYAHRAGIMEPYILHKMSAFGCTDTEIKYVKAIRRQKGAGLVYLGKETKPILARMMGVAGACLRNFVDAKVITLQDLLAQIKEGEIPDSTVLLIPNFFVSRSDGGRIADWHIAELLSLLYSRMARGQQTVLYVSDPNDLRKTYGDPMFAHLQNNFSSVAA